MREGHGHKGRHGHREHCEHGHHPNKIAQTFRRGRAIAFLDTLNTNRATLLRQLDDPSFEAIKPIISGELKATEKIIDEFIQMFQLHELLSDENSSTDTVNEEDRGSDKN